MAPLKPLIGSGQPSAAESRSHPGQLLPIAPLASAVAQPFTAASHHDVLVLLVQAAVLLATARLLGEVAQRLRQPSVVGELLAGIVLGPSLLSGLVPAAGQWLVPQTPVQGHLLEVLSLLGTLFLLFITGLETDLTLIRRHARTAIGVSLGGIVVTFSSGFALGQLLPDDLLVDSSRRLVFALFLATAMSISAIPVIAKVLMDMNLLRRDVGQTILAAGMSDDTTGWILLSIVSGLASGSAVNAGTIAKAVGSVAVFMLVSFTVVRWLIRKTLPLAQNYLISRDKVLSLLVVGMFGWAAVTQGLGLEAPLGAFVLGILFGQTNSLSEELTERLHSVALGIFTPIFFAVSGLKVDLRQLLQPRLALLAVTVIAVACVGKIVGTYLGARLIGRRDHWTALSYGAGLNARGAMEIIIATIGLSLGILSQSMFSIIVLMAMVTSLMAPTALRWVLQHVKTSPEEQQRLEQEALRSNNLVANLRRVLMPVRHRMSLSSNTVQLVAARILEKLRSQSPLAITLLSVTKPEYTQQSDEFLASLTQLFPRQQLTRKVLAGTDPGHVILQEAKNDYDLLVIGAPQPSAERAVMFTPLVDHLIRLAPCPTMLVHGHDLPADWVPRRLLVPTNGSLEAQRAAEVAFAMHTGDEIVRILTVIEELSDAYHLDPEGAMLERQIQAGRQIVQELCRRGESLGAITEAKVLVGSAPERLILQHAREFHADLIIVGTSVRPGSHRLFLGPRVERLLRNAPCAVMVVNSA